jgi:prepilin-type N-terminal cleavage/methylation domain-containing protein
MNNKMRRLNLKEKLGFTLIELLIVIALLGSIMALAAPNFMDALDGSKDKADAAQMDFLLNGFQSRQAPFYDSHTNPYDMLNPVYANEDGTQDAEQALNLYLADVLDSSSEVYIEGVQCVTKEQAKMNDGTSVFQAESNNDKLWISCKLDGNRSNAEISIPESDPIDYAYSAGEGIQWGDTLLYVGDRENLETRFVGNTCQDYQLEAEFYIDNFKHTDKDKDSHMGIVFNYLDDENFYMIDFIFKNGMKNVVVYQVVENSWTVELDKTKLSKDINVPGNEDFNETQEFDLKMQIVNSVSGETTVTFWMKPQDDIYLGEVFTHTISLSEEEKSSRYGFYIGEPTGGTTGQNNYDGSGAVIEELGLNDVVDLDDPTTFNYQNVQIQLLSYPTFICENEDGTYDEEDPSSGEERTITITEPDFTSDRVVAHSTPSPDAGKNEKFQYQFYKNGSWLSDWDDSGDFTAGVDEDRIRIRVLRSSSVVAGPEEFEKLVVGTSYGTPRFTYNYNSDTNPITINVDDNFVEYLWVDGIANDSQPGDSETGTRTGMNQISPAGLGSKTGWLWARDYDENGHGDWETTPWINMDTLSGLVWQEVPDLATKTITCSSSQLPDGIHVKVSESEEGPWTDNVEISNVMNETNTIVYSVVTWNSTLGEDLRVSNRIEKTYTGDYVVPVEPEAFYVDVTLTYLQTTGWDMELTGNQKYSYILSSYDKNNKLQIHLESNGVTGAQSFNIGKQSTRYDLQITDKMDKVYTSNKSLPSEPYRIK